MFTYSQSKGTLTDSSGKIIGNGWAGQLEGQNNPAMQNVKGIGPLPRGMYTIGKAYLHKDLGPIVMNLEPDPANEMFGRSLFRIHGASKTKPALSSHGCVIMPPSVRKLVDSSKDKRLLVVE